MAAWLEFKGHGLLITPGRAKDDRDDQRQHHHAMNSFGPARMVRKKSVRRCNITQPCAVTCRITLQDSIGWHRYFLISLRKTIVTSCTPKPAGVQRERYIECR